MSIKITGMDDVIKSLKRIQKKVEGLEGDVSFEKLFPPGFMKKFTSFSSIQDMIEKSPFIVESQEDFHDISAEEWNSFVNKTTSFQSWDEMQAKASEEYFAKAFK